jgi:hypothetical protein
MPQETRNPDTMTRRQHSDRDPSSPPSFRRSRATFGRRVELSILACSPGGVVTLRLVRPQEPSMQTSTAEVSLRLPASISHFL